MNEARKMRILHIEDNEADAELVGHALDAAALDYDIVVARSHRECAAALKSSKFDLVLSDSHGHDFTGLDLLHLVREYLPHVPFIFLSGSFDDNDEEMLKAEGAADCLLKDELDVLVPAIRRALTSPR